jgi:hypothetical protein
MESMADSGNVTPLTAARYCEGRRGSRIEKTGLEKLKVAGMKANLKSLQAEVRPGEFASLIG